jgi:hypothetical protein
MVMEGMLQGFAAKDCDAEIEELFRRCSARPVYASKEKRSATFGSRIEIGRRLKLPAIVFSLFASNEVQSVCPSQEEQARSSSSSAPRRQS